MPDAWLEAAKHSPTYKMAVDWKVALPLHPEYRTLPMVWYVPPLSPINSAANAGHIGMFGELPDVRSLRIPVRYLANLLTAGDEAPVVNALERMLAMRAFMRERHVDKRENAAVLKQVGLTIDQVEQMYRYMAIANYEDRFVIPTTHREYAENAYDLRGGCGFSFGNGCSDGETKTSLFGGKKKVIPIKEAVMMLALKALAALLSYPTPELQQALGEVRNAIAAERRLKRDDRERVDGLIAQLAASDAIDLQETYVGLFDRGRATSLQPLRARARRFARPRAGDGRPREHLSERRPRACERRAARLPAGAARIPVDAPARGSARDAVRLRAPAARDRRCAAAAPVALRGGSRRAARDRRRAAVSTARAQSTTRPMREALDEEWAEPPVLFGLGCGDARDNGAPKPVRFVRKAA